MDKVPAKPATIEDVARLAGVSIATVSRAISKPKKVAESTRKKSQRSDCANWVHSERHGAEPAHATIQDGDGFGQIYF